MRPPKRKFILLARYTHVSWRRQSAVELRRYPGGAIFEVEVLPDGKESAREVSETYARTSIRLEVSEGPSHRYLTPDGEAFLSAPEGRTKKSRPRRRRNTGD